MEGAVQKVTSNGPDCTPNGATGGTTTTLSTIAVQSGQARIVIALLSCNDWLMLKLLDIQPELTSLCDTHDQAVEHLRAHKDVLRQLQDKSTPIEELARKAHHLKGSAKEPIYNAMNASLTKGWQDILSALELAKEVLELNVEYQLKAQEYYAKVADLTTIGSSRLPSSLSSPPTVTLDTIQTLRKSSLESLMIALQAGSMLLTKLKAIAVDSKSLDSRIPSHFQLHTARATAQVENWLEDLYIKRQVFENVYNTTKSQLEEHNTEAHLNELSDKIADEEQQLCNFWRLGGDHSSVGAQLALHEHGKYLSMCQQLQEDALRSTKINQKNEPFAEKSYEILSSATELVSNAQRAGNVLERAAEFFRLAENALISLDQIDLMLTTTTNASVHTKCAKEIEEICIEVQQCAKTIVQDSAHHDFDSTGIRKLLNQLNNRKNTLLNICQKNRKVNDALNYFLEQYELICEWLNDTAKAFIASHKVMGRSNTEAVAFLESHNTLLNEFQKKGNEINALLLTLPPILDALEDEQRKDVDTKVDTLHESWTQLKNSFDCRLDFAKSFVEFHRKVECVVAAEKQFENRVNQQTVCDITDDHLSELQEEWKDLIKEFEDIQEIHTRFFKEISHINQEIIDTTSTRECIQDVMLEIAHRQDSVKTVWKNFNITLERYKSNREKVKSISDEVIQIEKLVQSFSLDLYPVLGGRTFISADAVSVHLESKLTDVSASKSRINLQISDIISKLSAIRNNSSAVDDLVGKLSSELSLLLEKLKAETIQYEQLVKQILGYCEILSNINNATMSISSSKDSNEILLYSSLKENIERHFNEAQLALDRISQEISSIGQCEEATKTDTQILHDLLAFLENMWKQQEHLKQRKIKSLKEICNFEEHFTEIEKAIDVLSGSVTTILHVIQSRISLPAATESLNQLIGCQNKMQALEKEIDAFRIAGNQLISDENVNGDDINSKIFNISNKWSDINKEIINAKEQLQRIIINLRFIEDIKKWLNEGQNLLSNLALETATNASSPTTIGTLIKKVDTFVERNQIYEINKLKESMPETFYELGLYQLVNDSHELLSALSSSSTKLRELLNDLRDAEQKQFAPKFSMELLDGEIDDNRRAEPYDMVCEVSGNPTPTIQWLKNGLPLDQTQDAEFSHSHLSYTTHFDGIGRCALTIHKPSDTLDSNCQISCKATNVKGTAITTAQIHISAKAVAELHSSIASREDENDSSRSESSRYKEGGQLTTLHTDVVDQGQQYQQQQQQPNRDSYYDLSLIQSSANVTTIESLTAAPAAAASTTADCSSSTASSSLLPVPELGAASQNQQISTNLQYAGGGSGPSDDDVLPLAAILGAPSKTTGYCQINRLDQHLRAVTSPTMKTIVKPSIQHPLADISVLEGKKCHLECVIVGQPEPEVIWYHNEKPLKESPNKQLLFQDDRCTLILRESSVDDSGEYKVVAINAAGEATSCCKLSVKCRTPNGSPKFIKLLSDVLVSEGEPVVFSANVVGHPMPDIIWLLNNQPINPATDKHVRITHNNENGDISLEIDQVEVNDKGVYTIKAVNEAGNAKCFAQLIVKSLKPSTVSAQHTVEVPHEETKTAPVFRQSFATDVECIEGTSAKFECIVFGKPTPKVKWLFNGQPVSGREMLISNVADRHILSIPEVALAQNGGLVQCVAENEMGAERCEARLTVLASRMPELVDPDTAQTHNPVEDQQARSEQKNICHVVTEEKQQVEVRESNKVQEYRKMYNEFVAGDAALTTAEHPHEPPTVVKVIHKSAPKSRAPRFLTPVMGKIVDQGADVCLEGDIDGQPTPTITWMKGGTTISAQTDGHITTAFNLNRVTLRIAQASSADAGRYTCTLSNEVGQASCTADVIVKKTIFPPVFGKRLQAQMYKTGDRVHLEVEVTGTPDPTVTWYKDGVVIAASHSNILKTMRNSHILLIEKADKSVSGQYMVKATNAGGEAQCTADIVIVEDPKISKMEQYEQNNQQLESVDKHISSYTSVQSSVQQSFQSKTMSVQNRWNSGDFAVDLSDKATDARFVSDKREEVVSQITDSGYGMHSSSNLISKLDSSSIPLRSVLQSDIKLKQDSNAPNKLQEQSMQVLSSTTDTQDICKMSTFSEQKTNFVPAPVKFSSNTEFENTSKFDHQKSNDISIPILNRPISPYARPASIEPSAEGIAMEKAWAHRFTETTHEKKSRLPPPPPPLPPALSTTQLEDFSKTTDSSWSVQSTLERNWTPKPNTTTESIPPIHYIAQVSDPAHTLNDINHKLDKSPHVIDSKPLGYIHKHNTSSVKEHHSFSSSTSHQESFEASKLGGHVPSAPPPPLRPVSVQDITDELFLLQPGTPPEMDFAAAPPPLPPKYEQPQPPPIPAKMATKETHFQRFERTSNQDKPFAPANKFSHVPHDRSRLNVDNSQYSTSMSAMTKCESTSSKTIMQYSTNNSNEVKMISYGVDGYTADTDEPIRSHQPHLIPEERSMYPQPAKTIQIRPRDNTPLTKQNHNPTTQTNRRAQNGFVSAPSPSKFVKGDFRESDYESDSEFKVPAIWGSKADLRYRPVKPSLSKRSASQGPPTAHERVDSRPKFEPIEKVRDVHFLQGGITPHLRPSTIFKPTPVLKPGSPPEIGFAPPRSQFLQTSATNNQPQTEYSTLSDKTSTSCHNSSSVSETVKRFSSQSNSRPSSVPPPPAFCTLPRNFRSQSQEPTGIVLQPEPEPEYGYISHHPSEERTTGVKQQTSTQSNANYFNQRPVLKYKDEQPLYREESRASQYGSKQIDPDTGLIYFKYDFGYELGVVFPGQNKMSAGRGVQMPRKVSSVQWEPHKRTGDIIVPVYHESSALNSKKNVKWDPTSESELSDGGATKPFNSSWEQSSCSPFSMSPSFPSTSPAFHNYSPAVPNCPDTPTNCQAICQNARVPLFTTPLRDIAVMASQSAKFECIVQAEPAANIIWSRNGRIVESSNEYQIFYRNGVCRLTIARAFPEDAGTYVCSANNCMGTASTTASLDVPGERRSFYLKH